MRGFRLDKTVDFMVMTGHAFQVFLTDADVDAALATMRANLAPAGRAAFETRNPLVRDWETWVLPENWDRVDVPGIGPVEVSYEIESETEDRVGFASRYRFLKAGDEIVTHSVLRFMPQHALAAALERAGLKALSWHGDWDGSVYTPASREIIVTATPA